MGAAESLQVFGAAEDGHPTYRQHQSRTAINLDLPRLGPEVITAPVVFRHGADDSGPRTPRASRTWSATSAAPGVVRRPGDDDVRVPRQPRRGGVGDRNRDARPQRVALSVVEAR